MTTRTRIVSLLMAIVTTLYLSPAAMADTDTAPVSATLVDDTCSFDITGSKGDLGTWTYDTAAGQYALTSSTSSIAISGDFVKMPAGGCDLTVQFEGLTGPGGEIGLTRFQATDASGLVGPGGWLVAGITSSSYRFDLTLNSVPVMDPGEYTGQISVSVTRAA